MAKSLVRVEIIPEVVGPIEVIVEVGVRPPSVGHAPAVPAITPVLAPSEQAPLRPVLGAAAVLLVPPVRQRAQVMVGWPTGIAFIKTRSLVVRAQTTLSSLLAQAWYQRRRTRVLSILIEGGARPIPQQRRFLLLEGQRALGRVRPPRRVWLSLRSLHVSLRPHQGALWRSLLALGTRRPTHFLRRSQH